MLAFQVSDALNIRSRRYIKNVTLREGFGVAALRAYRGKKVTFQQHVGSGSGKASTVEEHVFAGATSNAKRCCSCGIGPAGRPGKPGPAGKNGEQACSRLRSLGGMLPDRYILPPAETVPPAYHPIARKNKGAFEGIPLSHVKTPPQQVSSGTLFKFKENGFLSEKCSLMTDSDPPSGPQRLTAEQNMSGVLGGLRIMSEGNLGFLQNVFFSSFFFLSAPLVSPAVCVFHNILTKLSSCFHWLTQNIREN